MTEAMMQTGEEYNDVVDVLRAQHQQIRTLLERVTDATGDARQEAFDDLREYLARHETAEEMIVRPLTRGIDGGKDVASQRMEEENESKDVLSELEKLDVTSAEFDNKYAEFRKSVLEHAEAEETQEFPLLQSNVSPGDREKAKTHLIMAEKTAPTHPHPTARSTTANYVAGPFAAMLDRARDAIGKVVSS
jgi:hemerythrin superfamily protein